MTSANDIAISTRLALAKAMRDSNSMNFSAPMCALTRQRADLFPSRVSRCSVGGFRECCGPSIVAVDPAGIGRLPHEGVLRRRALDARGALPPRRLEAGEC